MIASLFNEFEKTIKCKQVGHIIAVNKNPIVSGSKKRRKTRFTHTCSVVFSKRMNRICFVLRIFLSILQKFIPLFG
ncbi:MAG: hypothetical protein AAF600_14695, partial [Bacteroidota bacterium]